MRVKYLLFFLFVCLTKLVLSSTIDSLKQVLKNNKNDSEKFELYNKLIRIYISYNIDSTPVFLDAQNEILLKNKFTPKVQNQKLIDWYNNSGIYNRRKGNYNKAINYYKKAYEIAVEIGSTKSQATELNNIANIYYDKSNFLISLDYHLKALRIRKEINDSSGIAMSLGNLGMIYESRKEYQKAIENYKLSRNLFASLKNERATAWCDRAIGVAYLDNKEFNEAKIYLNESYRICKKLNNYEDMKFSLINLSSIYLHQYKKQEDSRYLDTVSIIFQEIEDLLRRQSTKRTVTSLLMIKAKYNYFKHLNKDALTLLDSAEKIVIDLELKTELKELYELKSIIYEELNKLDEALIYFKKFKTISDTIFNLEKEKEIGRKEALFEYEKQLKLEKIKFLNTQKISVFEQKIQMLVIISISLILGIITISFIIVFRKKQNNYNSLQHEKESLIKEFNSLEHAYTNILKNLNNIKDKSERGLKEVATNKALPNWVNDLSKREIEVLSCIAIGLTDKEIEKKLFISITTVRSHCRSIYRKLLVKNRVEAANIAKKHGLI